MLHPEAKIEKFDPEGQGQCRGQRSPMYYTVKWLLMANWPQRDKIVHLTQKVKGQCKGQRSPMGKMMTYDKVAPEDKNSKIWPKGQRSPMGKVTTVWRSDQIIIMVSTGDINFKHMVFCKSMV